jgi:adenosylcobyric acid synthase
MPAKAIMFQGTGSDVGKSLIVAGLARAFRNRGLRVMPFKPQNMSNNAAVTSDGGEIGRAQALQARAARVFTTVHMNPVLLKPQSEVGAQVVVQGRVIGTARADAYQAMKPQFMPAVMQSFAGLCDAADIVLVEGAGSASEVNLRANDIANMGFARRAQVPVVLIGDIDRGGVIASLVGTKAVLPEADARLIEAFIVNKFRGDAALFKEGMTRVAELTGWRALGLVPHFADAARLPAEDALAIDTPRPAKPDAKVRVVVLAYPHVSNFDDFDPLRLEPEVDVIFLRAPAAIPADAQLVILPGSKATIADLAALRAAGWEVDLAAHVRRGGQVLGLCGGYQMLGTSISDPNGIEGEPSTVPGLGYLDIETHMLNEKALYEVHGESWEDGVPFKGYEMHVGESFGEGTARPLLRIAEQRPDGAVSADGRICGCYVHGLFADDRMRAHWLSHLGIERSALDYEANVDATLDALARHLERHLACDTILDIARAPDLKG